MQPDDRLQPSHIRAADSPRTIPPAHSAHSEDHGVSTGFSAGTGRRIKIAAAAAAVALLVGFLVVHFLKLSEATQLSHASKAAAASKPAVNVIIARTGEGTRPLTLPGETAAWFESIIYARVNGYVAKWYVDIGDRVHQGEVLATIDTPELDADLNAAHAELTAAKAQVKLRESEAEFAKTTNERWRDSPKGVVSEQERDAKRSDYDSAVAKLNAASAQVALDQARVDRLIALTRFKQVTAPFDATITERRVDIGNLVTAGSTSGNTPLYRMSQENPMRVFVDVPQSAAGDLMKPGVPVDVKAANVPGHVFAAKIARTAKAINPQARTLRVEVDIPNPDQALVPGMYVDVGFKLQSDNLVQVPAAALVFRSSGPQVAVVDGAGRVSFRKVTIARDEGSMVALGSGVTAGERVALNISSQIAEGDAVAVSESGDGSTTTALKSR
ncbi:MAG: efflux RND transporter periplasmic adaptor subunit [Proteobacteria bacterium]|nr:MAG: efflux RND transporter periplasmic adaptor subunit [Pseudomonadota bacterium]